VPTNEAPVITTQNADLALHVASCRRRSVMLERNLASPVSCGAQPETTCH
jgi:hypothetical protein